MRHVAKNEVITEVIPFLQKGFVRLDMGSIREKLETLPWVFEVRLQREWPNSVVIEIVEQQAIAQWGDKGYLNHRGELFTPEQVNVQKGLPVLDGPENSTKQVMDYYRSVGDLMREQGLALQSLTLDKRGSWRALLAARFEFDAAELDITELSDAENSRIKNNSVEVVIGRDEVLEKMQRFIQVYNKALPKNLVAVKKVDMRYSNGVAVSWHQQS
ncbi:MAG: cell division protein FtsQ [Pseudohongiellaceae bacterium]